MKYIIIFDFGSTYTKLSVIDRQKAEVALTARVPSTVGTDALLCMEQCFDIVRNRLGDADFSRSLKLASSSAAGGLRMAVIGLTHSLSISAGRNAAFGAGAKILGTFVGHITDDDIKRLEGLNIEIILFCGGYEDGSTVALEHNADMLANSGIVAPVIYAGNSSLARQIQTKFILSKKKCFPVNNIIPRVGVLEIEPSEKIIREIFIKSIVNMKGLQEVQARLDGPLIPTPVAVLDAGELLSIGTGSSEGIGPLMIVDVGGATTDIYSYVEQTKYQGASLIGSPEPYARRTVEGDMGIRESLGCMIDEIDLKKCVLASSIGVDDLRNKINKRIKTISYIADTELERKLDNILAAEAVHVAARRHAGWIKYVHSSNVTAQQYGKNLSPIRLVIGTGGPIINSDSPEVILQEVCSDPMGSDNLLPESVNFYLDKHYIFYAAGILRHYDAELAMEIMRKSLRSCN
ncbi:MAG: glutamate mutase L [Deltaproteobacteria bacterium]|jgi:uncharacterized protein (TIGR01319 family)|nr:glutamate mutase L [Deltaproteobacteria bacterium]